MAISKDFISKAQLGVKSLHSLRTQVVAKKEKQEEVLENVPIVENVPVGDYYKRL